MRQKAARGDLHTTVAIGYQRGTDDRLEQDPDQRVREALSLVFRKFVEIGSVRQLVLWLRQEGMTCRPLCMVLKGVWCGGPRHATMPCIGC